MKANELRIGNLVNTINREGEIHLPNSMVFSVQEIGFDCILCDIDKIPAQEKTLPIFAVRDLCPIDLTEEWAIKCGFVKQKWQGYNPAGYCDYVLNDVIRLEKREVFSFNCYGHPYDESIESNGFSFDVLYVHQLQNLYFALVGEELEIKK